ncbi:helix-turn-helix transcriptional regulator [Hydrogenovibrio halophilus]|uniref:helix-turn-helix transcriptional regulator n=1 Tax=Hydrogenovibrio halophilus TaxID=373391 RepID=UPI0003617DB9|nr:helix-turn-helix transcriptional regulator [Hydrogenovibrio halophilus]
MNAQIIFDPEGKKPEYAVIPWEEYQRLVTQDATPEDELIAFDVADYIDNPIKSARIKANLTQVQLAERLGVSQAYIGKIERASYKPTDRLVERVNKAANQAGATVSTEA